MAELWFFLVALMFAVYVALDGFDFGVGVLHLFVAKTETERQQTLRSIGPVWDGNEVWLVAAGGTLLCVFPKLLAVTFSGFYLPLMIVLWLLIFRALGIELRHQLDHPLWVQFWDVAFAVASVLLALCFSAALGNVVRGLPLEEDGNFFLPLWTDLRVSEQPGVFDWYTLLVAAFGLIAVALHGALWLCARTDGDVRRRAEALLLPLFVALAVGLVAVSAATFAVNSRAASRLLLAAPGALIAGLSVAALCASVWFNRQKRYRWAFRLSATYVVVTIVGAAYALFPEALHARAEGLDLLLSDVAAAEKTLQGTLWWWIPGMLLATSYSVFAYHKLPSVFRVDDAPDH